MHHVAVNRSWLLILQNNLDRMVVCQYLSIFCGGFGCGLAFETGFPVTSLCSKATGLPVTSLCSKISRAMVSDVSVTYLSIPFTIRTQETVLSRNRDSIVISTP